MYTHTRLHSITWDSNDGPHFTFLISIFLILPLGVSLLICAELSPSSLCILLLAVRMLCSPWVGFSISTSKVLDVSSRTWVNVLVLRGIGREYGLFCIGVKDEGLGHSVRSDGEAMEDGVVLEEMWSGMKGVVCVLSKVWQGMKGEVCVLSGVWQGMEGEVCVLSGVWLGMEGEVCVLSGVWLRMEGEVRVLSKVW